MAQVNESCHDRVQFGDEDEQHVVRAEEEFTMANAGVPLNIVAAKNSGVTVRGTDDNQFHVKVCKAAMAPTEAEAKQLLSQIRVGHDGNQLQPTGPEGSRWTAFLIVQAPRNADIAAEGQNGPIALRDLAGKVNARVKNGPLDLKHLSGTVDAEARNGPISFSGSGGDIKLESQNGPLSVKLEGANWTGQSLTATTINGPVSISLPADYRSGVEVATHGYAPISCSAAGCENVQKVRDGGDRKMTFGNGETLVHIATSNGPVSINNSHAEY
jgi:hypothetical protein